MSDTATVPAAAGFKPKKSVALSGVAAGNTALCTVGRTGNDLHYRGYDILDLAAKCEFEEVAYLLLYGKLPTRAELDDYKKRLRGLRGLPQGVKTALEQLPVGAHPMDVLRVGVSVLGTLEPEPQTHTPQTALNVADRLMASLGSMLLYWYHFANSGKRIEVETADDSIGGHFLHLLHGKIPSEEWVRAMQVSLILYAEHEFNASTFTARVIAGTGSDMYSAIAGAIGALKGPKHGGANEVALEIQQRYHSPEEAEKDIRARVANKEVIIGFGHPVYTISDPRNVVIKKVAHDLSVSTGDLAMYNVAERLEMRDDGRQAHVPQPRLVLRRRVSRDGHSDGNVHADLRDRAHIGMERAHYGAARRRQDHSPRGELHRSGGSGVRAASRSAS